MSSSFSTLQGRFSKLHLLLIVLITLLSFSVYQNIVNYSLFSRLEHKTLPLEKLMALGTRNYPQYHAVSSSSLNSLFKNGLIGYDKIQKHVKPLFQISFKFKTFTEQHLEAFKSLANRLTEEARKRRIEGESLFSDTNWHLSTMIDVVSFPYEINVYFNSQKVSNQINTHSVVDVSKSKEFSTSEADVINKDTQDIAVLLTSLVFYEARLLLHHQSHIRRTEFLRFLNNNYLSLKKKNKFMGNFMEFAHEMLKEDKKQEIVTTVTDEDGYIASSYDTAFKSFSRSNNPDLVD